MSTPFDGGWNGTITVASQANNLTITMPGRSGTGVAITVGVCSPVIYAAFPDIAYTGVLSADEQKIHWNNDTFWSRDAN
jgi:hypothetical protein